MWYSYLIDKSVPWRLAIISIHIIIIWSSFYYCVGNSLRCIQLGFPRKTFYSKLCMYAATRSCDYRIDAKVKQETSRYVRDNLISLMPYSLLPNDDKAFHSENVDLMYKLCSAYIFKHREQVLEQLKTEGTSKNRE